MNEDGPDLVFEGEEALIAAMSKDPMSFKVATCPAELGDKWKEYQGSNNWEDLLYPHDSPILRTLLKFVKVANLLPEFGTPSPGYESLMLKKCGLDRSGYKIKTYLRATCGIELRGCIVLPNKSSLIGYMAVCEDEKEIARMGSRPVMIVYRGSKTPLEWMENLLSSGLTCFNNNVDPENGKPMVGSGFLSMYTSGTNRVPSLQDTVINGIERIIQSFPGEPLMVTIAGHSLGAALATLTAYDITTTFSQLPPAKAITFGGPRVGNKDFRDQLNTSGTKILRIENSANLITKLPPWRGFVHVGEELRLSSVESSCLSKVKFVTAHKLKTYDDLISARNPLKKC